MVGQVCPLPSLQAQSRVEKSGGWSWRFPAWGGGGEGLTGVYLQRKQTSFLSFTSLSPFCSVPTSCSGPS